MVIDCSSQMQTCQFIVLHEFIKPVYRFIMMTCKPCCKTVQSICVFLEELSRFRHCGEQNLCTKDKKTGVSPHEFQLFML